MHPQRQERQRCWKFGSGRVDRAEVVRDSIRTTVAREPRKSETDTKKCKCGMSSYPFRLFLTTYDFGHTIVYLYSDDDINNVASFFFRVHYCAPPKCYMTYV